MYSYRKTYARSRMTGGTVVLVTKGNATLLPAAGLVFSDAMIEEVQLLPSGCCWYITQRCTKYSSYLSIYPENRILNAYLVLLFGKLVYAYEYFSFLVNLSDCRNRSIVNSWSLG